MFLEAGLFLLLPAIALPCMPTSSPTNPPTASAPVTTTVSPATTTVSQTTTTPTTTTTTTTLAPTTATTTTVATTTTTNAKPPQCSACPDIYKPNCAEGVLLPPSGICNAAMEATSKVWGVSGNDCTFTFECPLTQNAWVVYLATTIPPWNAVSGQSLTITCGQQLFPFLPVGAWALQSGALILGIGCAYLPFGK